jgi:hypothetical protein
MVAKCSRCSGFAALVLEHNACRLKVTRCFICGHRVYPPEQTADDDFDPVVELLEAMGGSAGRGYWKWVELMLQKHPGRF